MREAIGGAMSIQFIIIFLLLVNSYLAFTVNYTKAFRVKNEIISIIEKNEGLTGVGDNQMCGDGTDSATACGQIQTYLNQVGYNTPEFNCPVGYVKQPGGYCTRPICEGTHNSQVWNHQYVGAHYAVITYVQIKFPIVENLLPALANVFAVQGESKTVYSSGTNTETQGGYLFCDPVSG